MHRWPILALACLALCGCLSDGRPVSDADCPYITPCNDPDLESSLPPTPLARLRVIQVSGQPLIPGCPTTLQVMAHLRQIAFDATRRDAMPDTDPDPSDSSCEPPEAPLLRAGRQRPNHDVAAR